MVEGIVEGIVENIVENIVEDIASPGPGQRSHPAGGNAVSLPFHFFTRNHHGASQRHVPGR